MSGKKNVKVVPTISIEELEDPIFNFGKLTPYTLLEYLTDNYSTVSDRGLNTNQVRMKSKWMLPMPIEAIFYQLRKAQEFAKEAGEEISDTAICSTGYNNLQATGLFKQACNKWRISSLLRVKHSQSSKHVSHLQLGMENIYPQILKILGTMRLIIPQRATMLRYVLWVVLD